MTDIQIFRIAKAYRTAIETARDDNNFIGDDFDNFPHRCCGDTSCLLAKFLRSKGQESIYVWGEDYTGQTHAWLVVKDKRVKNPVPILIDYPDEIKGILSKYSNKTYGGPITKLDYTEADVENGLIVDITADQFGESPVYVDHISDFYRQFEFRSANDFTELGSDRLIKIYRIIARYL